MTTPTKKNCHNCKWLDYYQRDDYYDNSPEGYFCNNREYPTEKSESKHLKQLENEKYREKGKVCHESY